MHYRELFSDLFTALINVYKLKRSVQMAFILTGFQEMWLQIVSNGMKKWMVKKFVDLVIHFAKDVQLMGFINNNV